MPVFTISWTIEHLSKCVSCKYYIIEMSAGVSDIEICNYAYEGQLALLTHCLKEKNIKVNSTDQVRCF